MLRSAVAANTLLQRVVATAPRAACNYHDTADIIGKREIVGYGINGRAIYADMVDFPFPAIRYKEPTSDIEALRTKEKGDWKKLSIEEKKALYRASFCQTFAEMTAPTGEWKSVIGLGMLGLSVGLFLFTFIKSQIYDEYPETFSEERRRAQLRRILDLRINPVDGTSSRWDYENNCWKN